MQQFVFEQNAPAPNPLAPRSENEIVQSWGGVFSPPIVSICCVTYNHAEYIEDALCGFLAQETSFPFEIVVRDDASTDGTTDIIHRYLERYPRIIRAIIETENQHSKGIRANPAIARLAKGEFIALCEGDDYWITLDKLEKQVGLLKAYPQATMSVARTVVCKEDGGRLACSNVFMGNDKDLQYFNEIKSTYFHTSTYLIRTETYRNVLFKYANKIEYGDTALRFMLVHVGPFALLKELVSVYRVTGHGIWTSLCKAKQLAWEIKATEGLYKNFDAKYCRYFGVKLFYLYMQMLRENVWAFNNRDPIINIMRFIYFSAIYGPFFFGGRLVRRVSRLLKI